MVDAAATAEALAQERVRARAINNPNRQRILQILDEQEFVATQELLARSGLAWGTLVYHLDVLLHADLVGTHLAGKQRVYFRLRSSAPDGLALEMRLSPNLARVIEAVLSRRCRSQQEFTEATGLSQRMCSYYLQKLQERGLILREADGNRALYHPTPQLLEVAQRPAAKP